MKADLLEAVDKSWIFSPDEGVSATLVGHSREQAIRYATDRGTTKLNIWRWYGDSLKQECTITIPKPPYP